MAAVNPVKFNVSVATGHPLFFTLPYARCRCYIGLVKGALKLPEVNLRTIRSMFSP